MRKTPKHQWLGAVTAVERAVMTHQNILHPGDRIWYIPTQELQLWDGAAWIVIGPGGGGGPLYTNLVPMPVDVGGWPAGSTFLLDTMQQMWDGLLYPYQYPAFTSFLITGISVLEVGDAIAGAQTFTWGTTNPANVAVNSIDIVNVTDAVNLIVGTANDGTQAYNFGAGITHAVPFTHVFRIDGVNTHVPPTTFTRNLSIYWEYRVFYGPSANIGPLVEADIEGLATSPLKTGYAGVYSFAGGGYKYICYPTAFGTATTFKDSLTGLDVAMEVPYVVLAVTNPFGVVANYRVHRTTNILGAAIDIIVS